VVSVLSVSGPNTRYRVVVTAFGRNPNDLATPASVYAETSCNVVDPPGRPQPLKAQAVSPPGSVELSIGGISNAACVESWEVGLDRNLMHEPLAKCILPVAAILTLP